MAEHGELVPGPTLIASQCGSGTCPAVYRTEDGRFLVQGTAVDAASEGIELPDGEILVEVPAEILAEAARATQ